MHEQKYSTPPALAAAILGWLLKDEWNTALGDYEEYYNELVAERGIQRANWWYYGQIIRLLPDQLFEKSYWGTLMFKNYILLGLRNLSKNKLSSLINLLGLSAALASTIVLFLFVQKISALDAFHEHGGHIFLVGHSVDLDGEQQLMGTTPMPLGPALAADFPQIERAVRFSNQQASVRAVRNTFQETMSFADAGFFEMFTFPLKKGQGTALTDQGAVIISSNMAEKYFRGQDPMGQTLTFTFENGVTEALTVQGIAEPFPASARFKFDFIVGYEKLFSSNLAVPNDWTAFTDATFIQLPFPENQTLVEEQLSQYKKIQNEANLSLPVQSFFLDNIKHPDLIRAWSIHKRIITAMPVWEMLGIVLVAMMVLLITCFNYITISLGSAVKRLKEIGIRKTAGAEKRQLIGQFLTENLVLCALSLLLGLLFAWTLIIPYVSNLINMQLQIDFMNNPGFWFFLIGLLAFVALVSGAYPAFYISSFQPVEILRGQQKRIEKKGLSRVLTTVQFVLTIMTICIAIFLTYLDDTLKNGDWGYDAMSTVVIPDLTEEQYVNIQQQVSQVPHVEGMARSEHHIGSSLAEKFIDVGGVENQAVFFGVGPSYLEVMGIKAREGRVFDERYFADNAASIVVNNALVQQEGWDNAVGQQVRIDDRAFTVIGVVDDFLLHPLAGKNYPVVFGLSETVNHNYLVLHVENRATKDVVKSLKEIWEREFPEFSPEIFVQNFVFQEYDKTVDIFSRFIGFLAIFALFISLMGLFGIASQRAGQRIKEVGIRKAMGASVIQIVLLVNRGFLLILGIATLIATPICYVGFRLLVEAIPLEIPMSVMPIILANVLVFVLAAAALLIQTKNLIKINPADALLNR